MAQNSKVTKWAKDNQEALYMLYEDDVLSEEQLRTLVNLKGDYDVSKQDAEFDKVKQLIQSKLTDERINNAVKNNQMSDNDAKVYGSLFKSVSSFDKPADNLLSSKLIEQIKSSGYKDIPLLEGMIGQLKGLSDNDTKEYIYNQRGYLDQSLPTKVIESIPDLQEYMTVQPSYGVKNTNYAKMFNDEEILDKLNEIPFRDIDYIARKNGMTGKELLNDMTNAKVAKDRNLVAHGGRWRDVFDGDKYHTLIDNPIASNLGGSMMTLFGRRQQEAIARGEEPSKWDIAGDVGEGLLYTAPLGRIAQPISIPAKMAYSGVTAAAVPHITEAYDAAVYDDKENPRSEYSEADALVGTGVNLVAPFAIRELGEGVGRITNSPKITKIWGQLAEGKSADDVIKDAEAVRNRIGRNQGRVSQPGTAGDLTPTYYKEAAGAGELSTAKENQLMKSLSKENGVSTPNQQALNAAVKDPHILNNDNLTVYKKTGNVKYNSELTNVDKYSPAEWTTLVKAMKNKEKTYLWHGQRKQVPDMKDIKAALDPDFVKKYQNSDYATSMFLKSNRELTGEDAIKNYLTNQFGNFTYADKSINIPGLSMLPVDVNQYLRDYNANKERKKAQEESMRRLPTLQSLYGDIE